MNSTFDARKGPVNKIINLGIVLAAGFLLVLLAGIFSNWLAVVDGIVFAVAYLPVVITRSVISPRDYDLNFDLLANSQALVLQVCAQFLTAFLSATGVLVPVVLYHSHYFTTTALYLTLIGGGLIFSTVYVFSKAFDAEEEIDDFGGVI